MGRYRRAEGLLVRAFEAEIRQSREEAALLTSLPRYLALTWLRLGDASQWAFLAGSGSQMIPRAEFDAASGGSDEPPVAALLLRTLAVRSARSGPHDAGLVTPLRLLSALYRRQGKYQEAEELLRRVLDNQEARLGTDHPNLIGTLAGLGALRIQQGQYEHAEELLRRALGLADVKRGAGQRALAAALHGLGLVSEAQGNRDEARKFMTRALEIEEANLGAEHPETKALASELMKLA
jgi:tetratricopeptide (TPR) repeat protein